MCDLGQVTAEQKGIQAEAAAKLSLFLHLLQRAAGKTVLNNSLNTQLLKIHTNHLC